MSEPKKRVCIVGAGPGGMCALYHLKLLAGDTVDIKCYEKQSTWGGMWNYTWRTGTDEYGETVHCCMYGNLWTIGPKEVMESVDYSFKDHFGKELSTYVPREIFAQYLEGRWTKGRCGDLTSSVDFRHVVHHVEYREKNDDFSVTVTDLLNQIDKTETFSHVIVATGVYGVPNVPEFPGIDSFPGRILHSKDFRNALEYKGESVLIIGGSFSASEIALQLIKYGSSSHVILSSRNAKLDIEKIPEGMDLRLLPERIEQNHVTFKDGSSASFDVIIFCTGYIYHFPFLNGNLRFDLESKRSSFYPSNLYKGTLWLKGGNNKLFHMGTSETYFNLPVSDVQAIWIAKYILRQIPGQSLSHAEMKKEADEWCTRARMIESPSETIAFMRDFAKEFCDDIGYKKEYIDRAHDLVDRTLKGRMSNICGYRDECYPNIYTGKVPPVHHTKWMDCLDDSFDLYLK